MDEIDKWETQYRKGLIEVLVLGTVIHQRKTYGYQLLVVLNELGLEITEGTLYPLLNRMEKNGWLTSEWSVPTEGGHPKREYRPSDASLANFPKLNQRIEHYFDVFNKIKGLS